MKVIVLALLLTLLPTLAGQTAVEARTGEQNCLALNIYYEARGSSQLDMKAVGSVTVNRVKSKNFSRSVCSVVYQPGQFSWTTDKYPNIPTDRKQWKLSQKIADDIISGEQEDVTSGATYFYDHKRVKPRWTRKMTETLRTNHHSYLKIV